MKVLHEQEHNLLKSLATNQSL